MDYRTYRINDTVTLSHIKTDRFKNARLSVVLTVPADTELSPLNSMLIPAAFRGTERYRSFRDFCRRSEELYAAAVSDINGRSGDCQTIGIKASMLNDTYISSEDRASGFSILDGVAEMAEELFFSPLYRAEDLETDKKNRIDIIRGRKNHAYAYGKYRFAKLMFGSDPYGLSLSGEEDQIAGITPDDLRRRREALVASAPVDIFYCGTADAEEVAGVMEKHLRGFGGRCVDSLPVSVVRCAGEPRSFVEEGLYTQSNLFMGFRTGTVLSDREYYATELMNIIFGDSSTSKLFMNLREKKSLCYFCGSSYDEIKGVMAVGCGIDGENYENAREEILLQLEEIKKGNISDNELDMAKHSVENDCRSAEDHPEDYELFGSEARYFGGPRTIGEYRQGVMTVTKEEIAEAAKRVTLDTTYMLRGTLKGGEEELEAD